MNPKYQFYLDGNISYPVWGDNLAKVIKREGGQMFFRESLNGSLVYNGSEYAYIVAQVFDKVFNVEIRYSTDNGATYTSYWKGYFKKQDCKVDMDTQTVEVTPQVRDKYTAIFENWEKEIDLIRMANPPAMQTIKAVRRPALQLYIAGEPTIFTYVSGMYWEASCQAETDDKKLIDDYHFSRITNKLIAITDQTGGMPEIFEGVPPDSPDLAYILTAANGYKFGYTPQGGGGELFEIVDGGGNPLYRYLGTSDYSGYPREITLVPVGGSGSSVKVSVRNLSVYSRLLLDTDAIPDTVLLDGQDIIDNNRNYRYVCPYNFNASYIGYTSLKTSDPTPYGLYQPGVYYMPPTFIGGGEAFPITPTAWGTMSVWVDATNLYNAFDEKGSKVFAVKNAYPLGNVIKSLLGEIDSTIFFTPTYSGSAFLYGDTPIESNDGKNYFITPKSNITNANYDQPAQKAPITLKSILDMLRDTFRCYWYLDGSIFHIEHIEFFRRGGSYTGTPIVDIDLTTDEADRNRKKWAFAQDKYTFDKSQLPGRYTFGWMDEVTEPFEGYPIQMLNGVSLQPRDGADEPVQVQQFTTDMDYLMLNPNSVSKDGFCLMKAGVREFIDQNNPITIVRSNAYPDFRMVTLFEYDGEPNERVYVRIGYTPPVYSPAYTLQLFAADAQGSIIEPLTIDLPYGAWDTTIPRDLLLPQGTKKIVARYYGGTIVLASFETDTYLSVLFYDYYPDGYNQPKHRLLQNGEMSFAYLQRYYIYDLPVTNYKINECGWVEINNKWELSQGVGLAQGIKRTKMQEVSFPALTDPNTQNLIKTNLGSGNVENITLNLSSRNAKATVGYEPT